MKTILRLTDLRLFLLLTVWASVFFPVQAQESLPPILDSLQRQLQTVADPAEKTKILNALAFQYIDIDAGKTLVYGQMALALAKEHHLTKEIGKACNNIAIHYQYGSDIGPAIQYYEQSIQYFQQAGEQKGAGDVLGNLGNLYYFMGNYAKSLDYQLQALRIFEKLNNRLGMANVMAGIAVVHMKLEQYDKAIHHDTLALNLYHDLGDEDGIALMLGNLANIYSDQGELEQAKDAYLKAIETYQKIGNLNGVARNLSNLATVYHEERDYERAQKVLKKALDIFLKSKDLTSAYNTTGNMGVSYYLSYKNFDRRDSIFHLIPGSRSSLIRESIRLLKEAVGMAQQSEDLDDLSSFSQSLALAYEDIGDLPNAYTYFKLQTAAKDSLYSIASRQTIEKLTTERELELKNKQIELDRLAVEKKRNERLYFAIAIGLLLLSVLFVYRNFANQKKSNVQLNRLNQQIGETNHALADKNQQLSQTLLELNATQEQLIVVEKQKENALIRSRISQDIHDDISAGLSKISWLAERFLAKTAPLGLDLGPLEKINAYSRDTVSKLGEIIWSSNPERDNLESLLSYMRQYIQHYMEDAPMRCRIDFPEQTPEMQLNPELRRNLYLVMKEALHNARKYSEAQEIVVAFALDNQHYRLTITDNGVGIAPGKAQGSGNGMINMQRRMAAVGGHAHVQTAAGQGVRMVFEGALED